MPKLSDKLRKAADTVLSSRGNIPVWDGPESDKDNGGITFSLLSRWLVCKERARLLMVEGLKPKDQFMSKIEYGNIWHCAEEAYGKGEDWQQAVTVYCQGLAHKYQADREDIRHWYNMCLTQFPMYIEYWSKHPEQQSRKSLFQEQVFKVPYRLPSGRTVYLRGKWDGGDLVEDGIWLQENKTKSQIDQVKIQRQLSYDLQVMIYAIAFDEQINNQGHGKGLLPPIFNDVGNNFKGVRYNVIRRSAHKTHESMYKKMTEDIANNRGGEWFARWNVEITQSDIENFKRECLNPILENLCYWWDWINDRARPISVPYAVNMFSWRHPFGIYSPLDEGGSSELDHYLANGSETGLQRTKQLFPELMEV